MTLDQFLKHHNTVGLLRAIATSPGDPLPRHLLADHAEEHGFGNVAAGQRWAAKHGKRPAAHDDETMRRHAGPFADLHYGGWFHPADQNDIPGDEYSDYSRQFRLPAAFGDPSGNMPTIYQSSPTTTVHDHERNFLQRSHELNWHPDSGEPMAPGTDEWSLPSTGTAEDPNHDRSQ
jgi:hypothetical protein